MTPTCQHFLVRCAVPMLLALLAAPGAFAAPPRSRLELPTSWYAITTGYRYDEATRFKRGWHRGADVRVLGSVARAVAPGVVRFAGVVAGRRVVTVFDRAGGVVVTYVGVDSIGVEIGDRVRVGDELARADALHVGAYDAERRSRYLPISQAAALAARSDGPKSSLAGAVVDRLVGAVRGDTPRVGARVAASSLIVPGARAQQAIVAPTVPGGSTVKRPVAQSKGATDALSVGATRSPAGAAIGAEARLPADDLVRPRRNARAPVGRLPGWLMAAPSDAARRGSRDTPSVGPSAVGIGGFAVPIVGARTVEAQRRRALAGSGARVARRGTGHPDETEPRVFPRPGGPRSARVASVGGIAPPSLAARFADAPATAPNASRASTASESRALLGNPSVMPRLRDASHRSGQSSEHDRGWQDTGWAALAALLVGGVVAGRRRRRRAGGAADDRGSEVSGIGMAPLLLPERAMADPTRACRRPAIACRDDSTSEPRAQQLEHA